MAMDPTQFCPKCKKTLALASYYTHKDGNKCEQCKKCQTMHIDNQNPETFLWLLKEMDVPYLKSAWDVLYKRAYEKDPYKITGMSVYGKYLSKMKLKQWQGYTYEDSARLQAEEDAKLSGAVAAGKIKPANELKEMYESGEISEAEFLTLSEEPAAGPPASSYYPTNNPGYVEVDIAIDLTEEDRLYLAMKWGRLYRPDQWVQLEQFYVSMSQSFDINGAAREDTLKKICKTSLKMDEAIDCGDIDAFQKLSRVYEPLMKSGKFTEAQNKEDTKGFVNTIGELVAICEKEEGFIPRYNFETNPDIVDKTIQDMKNYLYKLVTTDLGLGQQMEDAIKKIQIQRELDIAEDELETDISLDEIEHTILEDADITDYYEEINAQINADNEIIEGGDA